MATRGNAAKVQVHKTLSLIQKQQRKTWTRQGTGKLQSQKIQTSQLQEVPESLFKIKTNWQRQRERAMV